MDFIVKALKKFEGKKITPELEEEMTKVIIKTLNENCMVEITATFDIWSPTKECNLDGECVECKGPLEKENKYFCSACLEKDKNNV